MKLALQVLEHGVWYTVNTAPCGDVRNRSDLERCWLQWRECGFWGHLPMRIIEVRKYGQDIRCELVA